jgi:hypothetical protein
LKVPCSLMRERERCVSQCIFQRDWTVDPTAPPAISWNKKTGIFSVPKKVLWLL